jgi:hypothetical protein
MPFKLTCKKLNKFEQKSAYYNSFLVDENRSSVQFDERDWNTVAAFILKLKKITILIESDMIDVTPLLVIVFYLCFIALQIKKIVDARCCLSTPHSWAIQFCFSKQTKQKSFLHRTKTCRVEKFNLLLKHQHLKDKVFGTGPCTSTANNININ